MKNLSTLVFIVKKFSGLKSKTCDLNYRDFLTDADNEAGFSPSAGSIKKIMDFANSYEVLNSNSTGQIELNAN